MRQKFESRKFLLTLGTVLSSLGAALSGELSWNAAFMVVVGAVGAYLGVEGLRDVAATWKNGERPLERPQTHSDGPSHIRVPLEAQKRASGPPGMSGVALASLRAKLQEAGPEWSLSVGNLGLLHRAGVLTSEEVAAGVSEINRLARAAPSAP